MQNIERISSNWTLFLKVFVPTFWFVFYGAIVIALFVMPSGQINIFPGMKIAILIFYISGSVVVYYTLLNLKRVEFDEDFLYITNYFKTVRVPWHNIKSMKEKNIAVTKVGTFHFESPITFGRQIHFVESRSLIRQFKEAHPELLK